MANLKSTKKDIRRSEKRRDANSQKKSAIRTYSKNLMKAIKSKNKEDVAKLFTKYTSLIDKAAKKNIIHKKTADRNKSRMAIRIRKAEL